jgi:transposase InsO family protein
MTDAAHCYQNAVAERVNGILKDEFDLDAVFPAFSVAHTVVGTAIHTYNTLRPHGRLAMQTPLTVWAQAA